MSHVIAVMSHKGGTGKTSMVQNLGYELGKRAKVLLVDFDPQSNLTIGCGVEPHDLATTLHHGLHNSADVPPAILQRTYYDLLPTNLDLALAEQQLAGHYDRNNKLQDAVAAVQDNYDYVVIDTPPNLGFFAFNALTAANEVVVPLQCQPYALRAVDTTLQMVDLVKKNNRDLTIKALVLTMYDRRIALTKSVESAARQRFGALVPQTSIPVNVSISEAALEGEPAAVYAPRSAGAAAYCALTEELYG